MGTRIRGLRVGVIEGGEAVEGEEDGAGAFTEVLGRIALYAVLQGMYL